MARAGRAVLGWLKFLRLHFHLWGLVAIFFSVEFPLLCGGLAARCCLYWQPQEANATVKCYLRQLCAGSWVYHFLTVAVCLGLNYMLSDYIKM